jgi:hypothetical protein
MKNGTGTPRTKKYPPELMVTMFRKAAALRNEMLEAGFTDNGGAIHSAERIMNILGMGLNYPGLSHINNLRHFKDAEFSVEAWDLHQGGNKVLIEHVSPLRHLTQMAIEEIDKGVTDDQIKDFVRQHYKLALLSPSETLRLNKQNRSKVSIDRLSKAGIQVAIRNAHDAQPGGPPDAAR